MPLRKRNIPVTSSKTKEQQRSFLLMVFAFPSYFLPEDRLKSRLVVARVLKTAAGKWS
jgi:hypothetical protein